eukprot:Gb_25314 [translate_table: standard]
MTTAIDKVAAVLAPIGLHAVKEYIQGPEGTETNDAILNFFRDIPPQKQVGILRTYTEEFLSMHEDMQKGGVWWFESRAKHHQFWKCLTGCYILGSDYAENLIPVPNDVKFLLTVQFHPLLKFIGFRDFSARQEIIDDRWKLFLSISDKIHPLGNYWNLHLSFGAPFDNPILPNWLAIGMLAGSIWDAKNFKFLEPVTSMWTEVAEYYRNQGYNILVNFTSYYPENSGIRNWLDWPIFEGVPHIPGPQKVFWWDDPPPISKEY